MKLRSLKASCFLIPILASLLLYFWPPISDKKLLKLFSNEYFSEKHKKIERISISFLPPPFLKFVPNDAILKKKVVSKLCYFRMKNVVFLEQLLWGVFITE